MKAAIGLAGQWLGPATPYLRKVAPQKPEGVSINGKYPTGGSNPNY
jgi:hypothetical protein